MKDSEPSHRNNGRAESSFIGRTEYSSIPVGGQGRKEFSIFSPRNWRQKEKKKGQLLLNIKELSYQGESRLHLVSPEGALGEWEENFRRADLAHDATLNNFGGNSLVSLQIA